MEKPIAPKPGMKITINGTVGSRYYNLQIDIDDGSSTSFLHAAFTSSSVVLSTKNRGRMNNV